MPQAVNRFLFPSLPYDPDLSKNCSLRCVKCVTHSHGQPR